MALDGALGAVLAAAGRSTRMEIFKPLLPVNGLPLLEAGIRTLQAGGVEGCYVVTGHRAGDLRPLLIRTGAMEIYNPDYGHTDMFTSVRLGLARASAEGYERIFFLPGDIALFQARTIRAMAARRAELVLPRFQGRTGHPVLLGSACIGHVLRDGGSGGLRGAFTRFPGQREYLELSDPGILMDADTPEDYQALLEYAKNIEEDVV